MARRVSFPPPLLLISLCLVPLLLFAGRGAHGRFISSPADEASADLLLSDGVSSRPASESQTLLLPRLPRLFAAGQCEQTYGFLPCTTTVVGNMFLVISYGFLMYKAATYLSSGSELLLEIMGPGIVGGLFLPILGALPDAMLILGTSHTFPIEHTLFSLNLWSSWPCFLCDDGIYQLLRSDLVEFVILPLVVHEAMRGKCSLFFGICIVLHLDFIT